MGVARETKETIPCFVSVHLFGVLVFILGFTGSAWGQNFSDVVVFGDSLSDSGNFGSLQPLPPGSSFTTNPDPVWSEIVAQDFGASGRNDLAGGPNYAFAGACMNPATPCDADQSPTVTEQIAKYFFKSDGRADPNALYAIWGGVNDVADSLRRGMTLTRRQCIHWRRPQPSTSRRYGVFRKPAPAISWCSTCPTSVSPLMSPISPPASPNPCGKPF